MASLIVGKCILPNLPFMELIIKSLNSQEWEDVRCLERDEELEEKGVGMAGDRKDGNPFLAKRLKPVSGGGGEG